jgi:hypothetical protein
MAASFLQGGIAILDAKTIKMKKAAVNAAFLPPIYY